MIPPFIGDGYALIEGPRFRFDAVLAASERIIDALALRVGRETSFVTTSRPSYGRRIPWPEPGKEVARKVWRDMAVICEVVDEALEHPMAEITVKSFLLGKTWCVRQADGRITLPDHRTPVERIDPTPMLCLYGAMSPDRPGSYGVLTLPRMREVLAILRVAVDLPMEIETVSLGRKEDGAPTHQVAFLRLPHAHYGEGSGLIRVRCVTPDGVLVGGPDSLH